VGLLSATNVHRKDNLRATRAFNPLNVGLLSATGMGNVDAACTNMTFQSPQCGITLCDSICPRSVYYGAKELSIPSMWDYSLRQRRYHRTRRPRNYYLSIPSMWDYSLRRVSIALVS